MRDILFDDCVEFQDCFLFDGYFSPFEDVVDFRSYYPRVLLGEIGGLFNLSCKVVRSANIYSEEIEDECGDVFIYLLLFGRMLEIHDQNAVLASIRDCWAEPVVLLETEDDYYDECRNLIKKVDRFLDSGTEHLYNKEYFYEIFSSLRRVTKFITRLDWQQVINNFHQQIIQRHTDVNRYTVDGFYRGYFRIRIDKLLRFVGKVDLELPRKRIEFLERIWRHQAELYHPTSGKAGQLEVQPSQ